MKNLMYLICLLLSLASCSSVKTDRQVINDFLQKQLAGKEYDTLFLKAEEGSKAGVVRFYNSAHLYYKNNTYAFIPSAGYTTKDIALAWPLDSLKAPELKNEPEKTIHWVKEDFAIPVEITTENINTATFAKKHISIRNHVLYLSKPVYTNNKKYALFNFDNRSIAGLDDGFINDRGIILMHKENGTWKQIGVLKDNSYIE